MFGWDAADVCVLVGHLRLDGLVAFALPARALGEDAGDDEEEDQREGYREADEDDETDGEAIA